MSGPAKTEFDPLARASTLTRTKYLAASMKHKHSKEGGEVGVAMLADNAARLADDYDIAMWRIEALMGSLLDISARLRQLGTPEVRRAYEAAQTALKREMEPGHPNPGYPATVGMDGSVHAGRWHPDNDPFRAVGGGTRTRTCAHCGRACGDMAGGSGNVNSMPVCHPNEQGRPDCYRLITVHGHNPHRCQRGCHVEDGEAKW